MWHMRKLKHPCFCKKLKVPFLILNRSRRLYVSGLVYSITHSECLNRKTKHLIKTHMKLFVKIDQKAMKSALVWMENFLLEDMVYVL